MNTRAVSKRYMQAKTHIDRGAAVVLGALGIRLLISRGNVPYSPVAPSEPNGGKFSGIAILIDPLESTSDRSAFAAAPASIRTAQSYQARGSSIGACAWGGHGGESFRTASPP